MSKNLIPVSKEVDQSSSFQNLDRSAYLPRGLILANPGRILPQVINTEATDPPPNNVFHVQDETVSATVSSQGATDHVPALDQVSKVRALLGMDVVLLPINKGEKIPMIPKWQNLTIEEMNNAEHVGLLKRGNLGVLLGKPSGGLCAIDIDDDAY